jgi:hypothetical protein
MRQFTPEQIEWAKRERAEMNAAVVLLFSLVASGHIRLRRIEGSQKIATVLRQQTPRAA